MQPQKQELNRAKSYRVGEAAMLLGFCEETIYRLARQNLIAHFHGKRGVRIMGEEIERIRKEGVVKSSQK